MRSGASPQTAPKLNINLLGEAVLGAQEAERRYQGVRELVAREDVDYASIKVSSIVDHLPLWAADETVDHIVETLLPLYLEASRGEDPTFLNMDMEEYRDLELTLRVFEKLLDRPELASLHAGIVLQAYLPDAPSAMARLRRFAERRVAEGGEPVKVRLVKGANLAMEQVDASVHGLTQAPLLSKEATDAQYKRMLLEALDPEKLASVHLGVAGHNLFDVAFAHLLMQSRGIPAGPGHGVEFEMLAGMAPGQQAVVRETTGTMRLYVPVVHPRHFDVAVSYLVRRLEENASSQNFLSAAFQLDSSEDLFAREQQRFSPRAGPCPGGDLAAHPPRPGPRCGDRGRDDLPAAGLPRPAGGPRSLPQHPGHRPVDTDEPGVGRADHASHPRLADRRRGGPCRPPRDRRGRGRDPHRRARGAARLGFAGRREAGDDPAPRRRDHGRAPR